MILGGGKSREAQCFYSKVLDDSLTKTILDTNLPLLIIETIERKEPTCSYVVAPDDNFGASIVNAEYVEGNLALIDSSGVRYSSEANDDTYDYGMRIKIRGNSSAMKEKKPYKIKLSKSDDLLMRDNDKYKDKEWLLLKYDNLNMWVGFQMSLFMNMQWTPSFKFVNVIMNGDYRGLYMLTESVKRNADCRLNVDKDGYIIEYDPYWWNEDYYIKTQFSKKMGYTFKYPKEENFTKEIEESILCYLKEFENAILEEGNYEEYIDVESFAKWLLIQDIIGNTDGAGSNIIMTKRNVESKLEMGNMWDFDVIYTYKDNWSTIHIWDGCFFYYLLNNKNTLFLKTYCMIWEKDCPQLFDYLDSIDSLLSSNETSAMQKSCLMDGIRWNCEWDSIEQRILFVKEWFKDRKLFLTPRIESMKSLLVN